VNIAVIPARGGSKRVPRKNIRPFAGRPMIAWPIEAARSSGLFEHIVVSTEDEEIATLARELGAEAPFVRPAELADDHSGTLEVMAHAAAWAAAQGWAVEAICCLYATAPFTTPADLASARSKLADEGWDYVLAASRCPCALRSFRRAPDGAMEMLFPEHIPTRSQDLPDLYQDVGQYYWGRFDAWLEGRPIYGERTSFVELPPWRAQDIDTPEDWTMAEYLFELSQRTSDGQ
jgi:pseudaminic acid cytidylyltransferase